MARMRLKVGKDGRTRVTQAGKSGTFKVSTDKDGKTRVERDHAAALNKLDVSTRLQKLASKKVRPGKGRMA